MEDVHHHQTENSGSGTGRPLSSPISPSRAARGSPPRPPGTSSRGSQNEFESVRAASIAHLRSQIFQPRTRSRSTQLLNWGVVVLSLGQHDATSSSRAGGRYRDPDCCRRRRSGFAIGAKSTVGHHPQEPAPQRRLRCRRGTATTPQRFAAHPRVVPRIFGHSACFGVCTQNEVLSVADPASPIAETSTPGKGPVAYSVGPLQRVLRAGPTTV